MWIIKAYKEVDYMKAIYPVIFTQTEDAVLIEVPDLRILTEGKDMADAIYMARDAIELMCVTMEDDNEEIPTPSDIKDIDVKKGTFAEEGNSIISIVDIDSSEYRRKVDNKSVRRNVTLPSWLNYEAEQSHINVSKVLQDALMNVLGVSR